MKIVLWKNRFVSDEPRAFFGFTVRLCSKLSDLLRPRRCCLKKRSRLISCRWGAKIPNARHCTWKTYSYAKTNTNRNWTADKSPAQILQKDEWKRRKCVKTIYSYIYLISFFPLPNVSNGYREASRARGKLVDSPLRNCERGKWRLRYSRRDSQKISSKSLPQSTRYIKVKTLFRCRCGGGAVETYLQVVKQGCIYSIP